LSNYCLTIYNLVFDKHFRVYRKKRHNYIAILIVIGLGIHFSEQISWLLSVAEMITLFSYAAVNIDWDALVADKQKQIMQGTITAKIKREHTDSEGGTYYTYYITLDGVDEISIGINMYERVKVNDTFLLEKLPCSHIILKCLVNDVNII
jgi:hypothetical protein